MADADLLFRMAYTGSCPPGLDLLARAFIDTAVSQRPTTIAERVLGDCRPGAGGQTVLTLGFWTPREDGEAAFPDDDALRDLLAAQAPLPSGRTAQLRYSTRLLNYLSAFRFQTGAQSMALYQQSHHEPQTTTSSCCWMTCRGQQRKRGFFGRPTHGQNSATMLSKNPTRKST